MTIYYCDKCARELQSDKDNIHSVYSDENGDQELCDSCYWELSAERQSKREQE